MAKSILGQALSDLVSGIGRYIAVQITLLKLEVMEKSARIVSLTVAAVLLLALFMFFLLFISLAAALWLGDIFGNPALGYLSVAGFYFLAGMIVFAFRRKLFVRPVISYMSEIFFEEKENDKDE